IAATSACIAATWIGRNLDDPSGSARFCARGSILVGSPPSWALAPPHVIASATRDDTAIGRNGRACLGIENSPEGGRARERIGGFDAPRPGRFRRRPPRVRPRVSARWAPPSSATLSRGAENFARRVYTCA